MVEDGAFCASVESGKPAEEFRQLGHDRDQLRAGARYSTSWERHWTCLERCGTLASPHETYAIESKSLNGRQMHSLFGDGVALTRELEIAEGT